jgi:hypothetical protein
VAPHARQDPADAPAPPKPPCDAELADEELPPLLDPMDDDPECDPELPPEQAIGCPVTGSLQRCGKTTAVVTTPPPRMTKVIAVERLME